MTTQNLERQIRETQNEISTLEETLAQRLQKLDTLTEKLIKSGKVGVPYLMKEAWSKLTSRADWHIRPEEVDGKFRYTLKIKEGPINISLIYVPIYPTIGTLYIQGHLGTQQFWNEEIEVKHPIVPDFVKSERALDIVTQIMWGHLGLSGIKRDMPAPYGLMNDAQVKSLAKKTRKLNPKNAKEHGIYAAHYLHHKLQSDILKMLQKSKCAKAWREKDGKELEKLISQSKFPKANAAGEREFTQAFGSTRIEGKITMNNWGSEELRYKIYFEDKYMVARSSSWLRYQGQQNRWGTNNFGPASLEIACAEEILRKVNTWAGQHNKPFMRKRK